MNQKREVVVAGSANGAGIAKRSGRGMAGQGMTEYIVIVALIAVAAVGAYSYLGQSIRGASAGLAMEISGKNAKEGISAAEEAANKAVGTAKAKSTLADYGQSNH